MDGYEGAWVAEWMCEQWVSECQRGGPVGGWVNEFL